MLTDQDREYLADFFKPKAKPQVDLLANVSKEEGELDLSFLDISPRHVSLETEGERVQAMKVVYPDVPEPRLRQAVRDSLEEVVEMMLSPSRTPRELAVLTRLLANEKVTKKEVESDGYDSVVCRDLRKLGFNVLGFTGPNGNGYTLHLRGSTCIAGGNAQIPEKINREIRAQEYCGLCHRPKGKNPWAADHRVPRAVCGNVLMELEGVAAFQPACRGCNNKKGQACRACPNMNKSDISTCKTCYWAYPEHYEHIACREISNSETRVYPLKLNKKQWESLKNEADATGEDMQKTLARKLFG